MDNVEMNNLEYYEATVSGSRKFDLAPVSRAWDGSKAENSIRKWASSDGSGDKGKILWTKLRTAYGYYNPDEKENFTGYKLPFVDIIGGSPKVVFKALAAGVAALNGARGGVDMPDNERKTAYNLFSFYYKKFDKEPPELRSIEDLDFESDEFSEKDEYYRKDFFIEINTADVQENGVFEGYGSTFGGTPDSKGDIIAPGAFSETINHGGRNRNGIAMLWYHNPYEPVGVWLSIVEDSKGLRVKGQLNLEVQRGRELYSLLKMGAIKAMSIGWDFYRNNKGEIRKDSYEVIEKDDYYNRIRLLKQIELWEISLVTFPANRRAKITKVKSITDASTEREMERVLRDAGLSKSDAQYLVKLCRPSLRESGNDGNGDDADQNGDDNQSKIDIDSILKSLRMVNVTLEVSRKIHGS